jgi:hypothetical protein
MLTSNLIAATGTNLTATPRTNLPNASHQKVAQRDPNSERLGEANILEPQPRPDLEPEHEQHQDGEADAEPPGPVLDGVEVEVRRTHALVQVLAAAVR